MALDAEKRAAIIAMIERRTKANTVSPRVARQSLIDEGLYTSAGDLRPEYGGPSPKGPVTKRKK